MKKLIFVILLFGSIFNLLANGRSNPLEGNLAIVDPQLQDPIDTTHPDFNNTATGFWYQGISIKFLPFPFSVDCLDQVGELSYTKDYIAIDDSVAINNTYLTEPIEAYYIRLGFGSVYCWFYRKEAWTNGTPHFNESVCNTPTVGEHAPINTLENGSVANSGVFVGKYQTITLPLTTGLMVNTIIGITPPRPSTLDVQFNTVDDNVKPQSTGFVIPGVIYSFVSSYQETFPTVTTRYYYKTDISSKWNPLGDSHIFADDVLSGASFVYVRAYGYRADGNDGIKFSAGYIEKVLQVRHLPNLVVKETKYCGSSYYNFEITPTTTCDSLPKIKVFWENGSESDASGTAAELGVNTPVSYNVSTNDREDPNKSIVVMYYNSKGAPIFSTTISQALPTKLAQAQATDLMGCPGASGSINFTALESQQNSFNYSYSKDSVVYGDNPTIDVNVAGTYQPYYKAIKNSNSYCYQFDPVTVADKRPDNVTIVASDPTCGGGQGKITGTLVGTNNYTASLYSLVVGGSAPQKFTNKVLEVPVNAPQTNLLSTIVYNNSDVCAQQTSSIKSYASVSIIDTATTPNTGCSTLSNGSLTFKLIGGIQPIVSSSGGTLIAQGGGVYKVTGLSSGTITITVVEQNDGTCIKQFNYSIKSHLLKIDGITETIGCPGTNPYTETINVSGGSGSYNYSLDNSIWISNSTFANLAPKSPQQFYVKDNTTGCIVSTTKTLPDYNYSVSIDTSGFSACSSASGTVNLNIALPSGVSVVSVGAKDSWGTYTNPAVWNKVGSISGYTNVNSSGTALTINRGHRYCFYFKTSTGCTYESTAWELKNPPASLSATVTPTDETLCPSFHNGAVAVTATGGWGGYSYSSDNVSFGASSTFSSLAPGSYNFWVKDAKGCVSAPKQATVKPAVTPVVSLTTKHPCEGQANGWIYPSVDSWSGPVLSYTSSMPSGATASISAGAKFENLAAYSSYSLNLLINGSVCPSAAKVVDLKAFAPPVASGFVFDSATCASASNGAMSFTISGNAGGSCSAIVKEASGKTYSYSNLINGSSNKTVGLPSGTYSLQITDTAQCSYTIPLIILPISSNAVTISSLTSTAPICHGETNGTIAVSGGSGFGDWIVSIKDSLLADVVTDNILRSDLSFAKTYGSLTAGDYTVSISDTSNCSVSELVTVPQKAPIAFTVTKIRYVTTAQSSDGSLDYLVSGGNGHFKVTLQNPPAGAVVAPGKFSNLPAGTYTVQIKDSLNTAYCNAEQTFTIKAPQAPLIIVGANPQQPKCYASTNGSVTLNVTGGWGGYKYSKDSISWQSSSTIAGLTAGSYKFWVVDSLGAIKDTTIVLGQPEAIAVTAPVITDVSCNGGSNGAVAFTATGGTGAYSLKLDGESSATPLLPRTGLAAGIHTYTIADANGCSYTNSFTVNEPQKLVLQATLAGYNGYAIRCFGATDTIHVAATGGTAGYRYILGTSTDTISTSTFANLGNGTYKVKVVDAHGCVDSASLLLNAPTAVKWKKVTITDPSCNGVANGTISLQPDGGVSGYSYNIYRDANVVGLNMPSSDFNNLSVGDYRITVTDANGCSHDTTGLKLIEPDSLQINSFNTIASICKGDSGKAVVVLKGGTAPYTVKVGSDLYSANPSTQINLLAGNYTAYISDSKGCGIGRGNPNASDTTFTITEPTSKLTASPNVDPVKCFGESNGSVRLSATGGWGGYSYYLLDAANGNPPFNVTKTNLKAGSYKFVVSDSLNCHDTLSITVPQPQQLAALLNKVDVLCYGGHDGQLAVSDTLGGVQPYHYQLDGGTPTTSNLFPNLLAGAHQVSMVDANGCVLTKTETINQPDEIISTLVDSVNPPCGTSTGMLKVNVVGGTPTFNMSWDIAGTAVNGAQVSNLSAGNYNLTVTDGHGCQKPFTYTLVNPDAPQLENVAATDLRCFGDQSGKVEFYVNGTNQPVDVSLTLGGATVGSNHFSDKQTSNFSNLQAGSYELSMVDSHGCFSSKAITVAEPSKVTLTLDKRDVSCYNTATGAAIANVNGGIAPYNINWSTGKDVQTVSTDTLTQLQGGTYIATVTDSKGCGDKLLPLKDSITIIAPVTPLAFGSESIAKPKCAGESTGQALLSAQGGWGSYTFTLNGQSSSNGQFYSLASGSYPAILSDANGCSITKTVVVPQTLPLSLMASTVNNLTCYQNASGSIYVTPVNGETPFLYGLDGSSLGYSNGFGKLAAGTHTIVVQDKNGCSSQLDVLLTQPDSLNLDFTVVSDTCGRGVGLLAPMVYGGTQPFTYTYNDKVFEEALKHLYSGNYKISVKDRYGCRDSSIATVGDVSGPKIANVAVSPVSCAEKSDGAATITTVGGNGSVSVMWPGMNLSGVSVSGLPKGDVKAVATDEHQCSDTVTVSIPGPDPLTLAAANLVNPLCYGYTNGSATVSPMGGTAPYSILWNNGTVGGTVEQLPSGSYTAQVTDAHECQNSITLSLTDPDPIKPTVPTSAVLCSNQSIMLDAGYSGCDYSWTSTNGFTSNLRSVTISDEGTYTVWVTDIKGCKGSASVNLTKLAQDIDADFVVATTTAVGDTIVLVEFTMPIPDSIGWDFPGDAFTLIKREGNELHIRAEKEGTFPVALTTHMGECSDRFEKTVTVVPALPKNQNSDYYPNIFSEVKLYPNPNDGLFTVEVTLHNEAALEVGLYNSNQQQLFYQKLSPAGFFSISSDRLNLMPGFYLLSLRANGQTKTVKIIVQK